MKLLSAVRSQAGFYPVRHAWVTDTRIVSALAQEFGTVGEPFVTGELIAMNSDGRGIQYLYGYRRGQSDATFGGDSLGNVEDDRGSGRIAQIPRVPDGHLLMTGNYTARSMSPGSPANCLRWIWTAVATSTSTAERAGSA